MKNMKLFFFMIPACLSFFLLALSLFAALFADNKNGTITDSENKLLWQKCSMGLTGPDCSIGTAQPVTWESAQTYCRDLSVGDRRGWRLPAIAELRMLADKAKKNPAINETYFPKTESFSYWSSTSSSDYPAFILCFDFSYAYDGGEDRGNKAYVRCVLKI